jgi:DNA polymerase gamma 1
MHGTEELISLGEDVDVPRLMIAHNVAYDRQRILEAYNLRKTGLRFLDTMSLHMAVAGLSSQQKSGWSLRESEEFSENADEATSESTVWAGKGGPASLQDAYKFWCGKEMSKESRNIFVVGSIPEIRADFQKLMK